MQFAFNYARGKLCVIPPSFIVHCCFFMLLLYSFFNDDVWENSIFKRCCVCSLFYVTCYSSCIFVPSFTCVIKIYMFYLGRLLIFLTFFTFSFSLVLLNLFCCHLVQVRNLISHVSYSFFRPPCLCLLYSLRGNLLFS